MTPRFKGWKVEKWIPWLVFLFLIGVSATFVSVRADDGVIFPSSPPVDSSAITPPDPSSQATKSAPQNTKEEAPLPGFTGDIAKPDVLIVSKSLSSLPHDLLSIPVLKDLLTEDLVFYYKTGDENLLNFRGAILRLAFEHQELLADRLLSYLFDSPAEVAFWKGYDGKLKHFMAVMDDTGLKSLLTGIAKVALSDKLLKQETQRQVGNETVPIYRLTLSARSKVFLASESGRLYLFSDAQMPFPDESHRAEWKERIKSFFGMNDYVTGFASLYGIQPAHQTHSIVVGLKYLSFGYQRFFSHLESIRFDFEKGHWQSFVLRSKPSSPDPDGDTKALLAQGDLSSIWKAVPRGAGLCWVLPLEQSEIHRVADPLLGADASLVDHVHPNVASCWYPGSRVFTPVVVARTDLTAKDQQAIDRAFSRVVGSFEAKHSSPLPVQVSSSDGSLILSREVSSRYGSFPGSKSADQAKFYSKRFFRVKLALKNGYLVFSPDAQLVDQVLATIDRRYPSAAEVLSKQARKTPFFISPAPLSSLVRAEVLESLPASQESIFREAVSRHLLPKLDAMLKKPSYAALFPIKPLRKGESAGWEKMEWVPGETR